MLLKYFFLSKNYNLFINRLLRNILNYFFIIFLFFYCSNVFSQNFIFATLDGSPTLNTTGWNITGNAYVGNTSGTANTNNDELILTDNTNTQSGGVFWNQQIDLSICQKWIVEFDFRIADGGGADGLAFNFLDVPPAGLVSGGGVGIPATANGLKVILDTYDNNCAGPNPEIQIYSGVGYNECIAGLVRVDNTSGTLGFIRNTNYQRCRITYDAGDVEVFINNTLYLTGNAPANFAGYMGFTASTGGTNDRHSIKDVIIYTEQAIADAGADKTICNGESTTIGVVNNPAYIYSWSPLNGLSGSSTISNPTINLANTGNTPIQQTYVVSTTLATNPGVCPNTDTVVVTVNPTPTSLFSLSSSLTCIGTNVTVNYTGNMGGGASYNWDFDGGNVSAGNGQGPIDVSWNSTGTKNISLYVENNNCTSDTTILQISIDSTSVVNQVETACSEYTWPANGQIFTQSGSYTATLTASNGCDSIVNLDLTIVPEFGAAPDPTFFNSGTNGVGGTLSGGQPDLNWQVAANSINGTYNPAIVMALTPASYYTSPWPDARWISHNVSGDHVGNMDYFYKFEFDLACRDLCGEYFTDPNVYCLNLDFFADNSVLEIFINGVPQSPNIPQIPFTNPYFHSGFTQANILSLSFCDGWLPGKNEIILQVVSVPGFAGFLVQSSINLPPPPVTTISDTICQGENYNFGSQVLTTSGLYSEIFQNQFFCDSIVDLDLTVLPTYLFETTDTVCDTYTWTYNGQTYLQSGTYTDSLLTANGCDSVYQLNITIGTNSSDTVSVTSCGDYFWSANGQFYAQSGVYPYTVLTDLNCDSTTVLNLTVNLPDSSTTIQTACDQYDWNGQTYSQSGTYTFQTSTVQGCDSIATLDLTILNSSSANFTEVVCDTYTWNANNQTYTQSGTYQDTLVNALGCDSIVVLDLTINISYNDTLNITACDSFAWNYNNQTYFQSGLYSHTTQTSYQCDSTVTINLTINNTSSTQIIETVCDSFIWNGQTYFQSGNYSFQSTNANNCDSVANLDLTINTSYDIVLNETACDSFVWNVNNQTYFQSGTFTETLNAIGGCDSTITLNLSINPTSEDSISITTCDQYFWIFSGQSYTASGNYSHTVPNNNNCDSTIYLDLTITPCEDNCNNPDICYSTEPFPVANFNIEKRFESAENTAVYQTPLLADMDGDCVPEIIVAGTTGAVSTPRITSGIRFINSNTGATINNISTVFYAWSSPTSFAVADVDFDGSPEIVVAAADDAANPINIRGRLICYDNTGNIKWIANERYDSNVTYGFGGAPAFADFNQDGVPEVYIYNEIFNAQTGVKLCDGGNNGKGIADNTSSSLGSLSVTAAANLDGNFNDLELAAGYTTYKVAISNTNGTVGNTMTPYNIQVDGQLRDGFTSIADINGDGQLDIVVASDGVIGVARLYTYNILGSNATLIAQASPSAATGSLEYKIGPPFIGDIDGSGIPAIGITRSSRLITYQFNGTANLQQKWSLNTNDVSGQTGLTMFDFNQDGIQEIVYRDETDLLIYNGAGATPIVMASINCISNTGVERPIVGDIDNSGESKICVTCGPNLDGKLEVYSAPIGQQPWAPSRGVWNQFGYHVLNINDNLTVPALQLNNATHQNGFYNNFNVQASFVDSSGNFLVPAPDLTGEITCVDFDINTNEYNLTFYLTNYINASLDAPSGVEVAFFDGNPEINGTLIGTYLSQDTLGVGDTLNNLNFTFSGQGLNNLTTIYLVVNADGSQVGNNYQSSDYILNECDFTDNIIAYNITLAYDTIQDTICLGGQYTFYGNTYDAAGTYFENLQNTFGCDSAIVVLELFVNPILSSEDTVEVCDTFTWALNNQTFTQSGIYSDTVQTLDGCDSLVVLNLTILDSTTALVDTLVCNSYTAADGQTYTQSGNYTATIPNQAGCDSVITINLTVDYDTTITEVVTQCDTFIWASNNQTYTQSGIYTEIYPNINGCDSTRVLDLTITEKTFATIDTIVCDTYTAPDGQVYTQSGNYTAIITNAIGCDSIIDIDLQIFESAGGIASNDQEICIGDTPNDIVLNNFVGDIQWQTAENFDFTTNIIDINNANDSIFTFTPGDTLNQTFYLRAKVQLGPCIVDYSNVVTIIVNPLPVVDFPTLSGICVNDSGFVLNTATPTNGVYTGVGIGANDFFNPSVAGAGNHLLNYTYTDTNNCVSSDNSLIMVLDTSVLIFNNLPDVCVDADTFSLNTANPPGGVYSGNGLANNVFDPSAAGVGLQTITYTYENGDGCTNSTTASIRVNDLPIVTISGINNICINDELFTINAASPPNGVYSGTGVNNNNQFLAADAGVGNHIISFTHTDNNGCVNSDSATFVVNALPIVNFLSLNDVCLNDPALLLNQATPNNGVYSGNGVTNNNTFNPNIAGIGSHELVFTHTDNIGCVNTDTSEIVVLPLPTINITGTNTTICFGDTATLSPSGGQNYSWTTLFGNAVAGSGTINVSPQFTTDYILRGENNLGCANRDTIRVAVNQLPTVAVSSNANTICPQDTATLTASGAFSYTWSPSNEIYNNNNNTVQVSPPTPTTFEVTGTDFNGCENSTTINITLHNNPTLNITTTADTICNGETTSITVSGANTYNWTPNTGLNGNNLSTVNASPTNSITYQVTGTSADGCKSVDSVSITVIQLPIVQVSSANPNNLCLGDSVILTASGADTYVWTPSITLNTDTGTSVVASPNLTTTYFVTGTAGFGCKGTASVTVGVNPPLQLLSAGDLICLGEDATLTSFGSGGSGNLFYQWSPTDSVTNPNTNITTANPSQTTVYTITVSDDCGTQPISQQVTVEVLPLPIVSFDILPDSGCAPLSGDLINTSFNTNSCTWEVDGQFYSLDCNTSFEFANPGIHYVSLTMTDMQGCTNSISDSLEVFSNPTADFFFMPDTITILNTNVRFDGSISSEDVMFWEWEFSNLGIDTGVVAEFSFPEVGFYPITLIAENENNCRDTITYFIEIKDDYAIYIPNAFTPNEDGLNDTFGPIGVGIINNPELYNMKIFNRWGQLIYETDDLQKPWVGTANNLKSGELVPNGTYTYIIKLVDILGEPHSFTGKVTLIK